MIQNNEQKLNAPNFYIAGAPRCGTTALYQYLSENPYIYMSQVKELNYFAFDFPNVQKINFTSLNDYLKVFENANSKHHAIGEASPFYLFSKVAFQNIQSFDPNAKIIISLRNPVDFVQSFHQLNLSLLREDVSDLETAWGLQDQRKSGKKIPKSCREPELIQYGELGKFGTYIENLFKVFSRDQVMIIIFEDFVANPKKVYEEILTFIGAPNDNRSDFTPVNANFKNRSKFLAGLFHPPQAIYQLFMKTISLFGVNFMKNVTLFYNRIERLNVTNSKRQPIDPQFRLDLINYFREDIQLLSKLIDRDLTMWTE
jgi:hypothetical protein